MPKGEPTQLVDEARRTALQTYEWCPLISFKQLGRQVYSIIMAVYRLENRHLIFGICRDVRKRTPLQLHEQRRTAVAGWGADRAGSEMKAISTE